MPDKKLAKKLNRSVYAVRSKRYTLQLHRKREAPMYRWTPLELEFLRENWQNMGDEEIANILSRTLGAVTQKRYALGLKRRVHIFQPEEKWTKEELLFLEKNWETMRDEEIASFLNKNRWEVTNTRIGIGLTKNKGPKTHTWTYMKIHFLKENWTTMTDKELAQHLDKKVSAIRQKRISLGLSRGYAHGFEWTQDEIEILMNNWREKSDEELAFWLTARTPETIRCKRNMLGLLRPRGRKRK